MISGLNGMTNGKLVPCIKLVKAYFPGGNRDRDSFYLWAILGLCNGGPDHAGSSLRNGSGRFLGGARYV
jgi:hypothetical protein